MPSNTHHNTLAPRAGLGFRRELIPALHQGAPESIGFFEVAPENWAGMGGRAGRDFRAFTERYPFVCHGLSLSLGGPGPLDEILLRHADSCGAQVWEQCPVTKVTRTTNGWQIEANHAGQAQLINADWVIDASGRHCVMGRAMKLAKSALPYPGRMAVFNRGNTGLLRSLSTSASLHQAVTIASSS